MNLVSPDDKDTRERKENKGCWGKLALKDSPAKVEPEASKE